VSKIIQTNGVTHNYTPISGATTTEREREREIERESERGSNTNIASSCTRI